MKVLIENGADVNAVDDDNDYIGVAAEVISLILQLICFGKRVIDEQCVSSGESDIEGVVE